MKIKRFTGQKKAGKLAFTLPEVLIGTAIAAFVFSGFFLCLSEGIAVTRVARENLRAGQILEQQMETIRLYTWNEINSNGFVPPSFVMPLDATSTNTNTISIYVGSIVITNAPMTESYSNDHVLVTVSLTWTNGNMPRTRQMSTIVSKYGLHNYYY
ncbi:MAG TPA: hypothetical protein VFB72_11265 [Verrucomicrobiae bacterium]|nr:hypothetical protein [Verrucomicrobiae bacterium]